MPIFTRFAGVAGIILQYGLLLLVYYFLVRVLKAVYNDFFPRAQTANGGEMKITGEGLDQPAAQLVLIQSGNVSVPQTVYPLTKSLTLGRGPNNAIVLDDEFVSYEHACVRCSKDRYWLSDLHSTNGTLLNGRNIDGEVEMQVGDVLQIGDVSFRLER